jgi:uncharacterized protein
LNNLKKFIFGVIMPEEIQATDAIKMSVNVVENNMQAFLVCGENFQNDQISKEEILRIIEQAGIKFGLKDDAINDVLGRGKPGERYLIVEGQPSIAGEDGRIDFYFTTDKSLRPKILEDGHIDYRDVNLVNSVTKDSILLKRTLATPGSNGKDVFGNTIFAVPGKDVEINIGQGVYKDPADGSLIKAAIDGIIFYQEKKHSIEVQKLYQIPKSVDYSTGNINVKSSVDIKGDVKPHFSITTPYNVQVKGIVESATITCGGTLSVNGGIVGDGKQLIDVGGDIHAAYINNQKIKCHGIVTVNTEMRNTFVCCDDEVVIVKDGGVIIGGQIYATNRITVPSIGNAYNVPTEICVGLKLEFKEKFQNKDAERKAFQKQVEEIKKEIDETEQSLPGDSDSTYLKSLRNRWEECNEKLEKIRKELKEIEVDYYNVANPVITVKKNIYPGVIIKIKHAVLEVNEMFSNVKFILEGGIIKTINLK